MNEYKFHCPGCDQHLLANDQRGSRRNNSSSCDPRMIVPAPAKELKNNVPIAPAAMGTRPMARSDLPQTDLPAKQAGTASGRVEGSLGRLLADGAKEVSILGEKTAFKAALRMLNGFSAHTGQGARMGRLGHLAPVKPRNL